MVSVLILATTFFNFIGCLEFANRGQSSSSSFLTDSYIFSCGADGFLRAIKVDRLGQAEIFFSL